MNRLNIALKEQIDCTITDNKNLLMSEPDRTSMEDFETVSKFLVCLSQKGIKEAVELLCRMYLPIVSRWVRSDTEIQNFRHRKIEYEDLCQSCMTGIIQSIDKYNFELNTTVYWYFRKHAIYEIKNWYRSYGNVVISRADVSNYNRIINEINDFSYDVDMNKVKETAVKIGMDPEKAMHSFNAVRNRNNVYSIELDGSINCDTVALYKFGERMMNDYVLKEEQLIYSIDIGNYVKENDENDIIRDIFYKDKTQKEIASERGCTEANVSNKKKRILKNIKNKILSPDYCKSEN